MRSWCKSISSVAWPPIFITDCRKYETVSYGIHNARWRGRAMRLSALYTHYSPSWLQPRWHIMRYVARHPRVESYTRIMTSVLHAPTPLCGLLQFACSIKWFGTSGRVGSKKEWPAVNSAFDHFAANIQISTLAHQLTQLNEYSSMKLEIWTKFKFNLGSKSGNCNPKSTYFFFQRPTDFHNLKKNDKINDKNQLKLHNRLCMFQEFI